jgi:hypothetical protein
VALAGGFVFVSKATGEVREVAPGLDVLTEIDGMTDVKISLGE